MQKLWTWTKRIGVALYVLVAGAFGASGGPVIADRRAMYGDDPVNDPYSTEFDPAAKPARER